ncbi:hypothetical protein CA54_24680 [Symmachiella macrocystis]|uniref:Sulfatase n=1 Tax=Symmachiella macrocystis TaxID=2527985 RepID=A0A5C6BNA2_9PLAN|nr:DUF1501 domain-containing protein [Symmachiella macrocystis]TWU13633.1 hypothetical protein CA54_24680 [Symmachiella macrocystis]
MLQLLSDSGSPNFCDGLSRRRMLQVGGLGTLGLGLPQLLKANSEAASSASTFGRAKRVIFFFMWGGPAHQDTWDLKPDGPSATRGEFLPIATNVPGMHVSEHFPLISQHGDKLAIIRSVGQEDNNHSTGAHAGLTGRRHELKQERFAARETDFPHIGSVLSKLRPNAAGMPTFVSMPEIIATTDGTVTPGQFGGMLGKAHNPFQIDQHPDLPDFSISSLALRGGMNPQRMDTRRQLLEQIDDVRRLVDRDARVRDMDAFYARALNLVLSAEARRAFDISSESEETRRRYGWHTFGQSTLLARRLVEAGVKLVTVYWHREKPTVDASWDTHWLNNQELRNRLMPVVDRPIAALLEDLKASGLLDETLVIWNSEFGRSPRFNRYGGRDHWGACNSVVMAGGGVPGGQIFGASDEQAAHPISEKVTQDDIAATVYHLLGIEPETAIQDKLGRPYPVALGEPIHKLLGNRAQPEPSLDPPPILGRPKIGRFTQMLRERGLRYLTVDFGNPDSEADWKLAGFGEAVGEGLERYRQPAAEVARVTYQGIWHVMFDWAYLVLRCPEPRTLDGLVLTLEGQPLPIPENLAQEPPSKIWHIPFPPGTIAGSKNFDLEICGADWRLTDLVLVGDRISERHLGYV